MPMRIRFLFLGALIALLLSPPVLANRFPEFVRLRDAGKLEAALDALRAELADPSLISRRKDQRVIHRMHFLHTLGAHVRAVGISPAHDQEARKLYDEGVKYAEDDAELLAYMANGLAIYYSLSFRNGLAMPLFRKELEQWERKDNRFRLILTYDAIGSAYWDTGESELARFNFAKTLEAAAKYYVFGERPKDINEWLQYWILLGKQMDNFAQLGDQAALEKLWALYEPIAGRYWNMAALAYQNGAQFFAAAGRAERARELLARARQLWSTESVRFASNQRIMQGTEASFACTEATIAFFAADHAAAAPAYERCIEGNKALGTAEGEMNLGQKRGISYEALGQTDKAIAAFRSSIAATEKTRESYSVAQRARFFRTIARNGYWGLTRIMARRAAAGDEAGFFEALHTSELVRGRQLGELIDPDMASRITPASLKALQLRLPPDAVVLAYTATETELVMLALARDRVLAAVTSYDSRAFATLARRITADLANPVSNRAELESRLLELSRPVLAAARPLIVGKARLIVLPDGIMNTVPFELLSLSESAYRPLIADYVVASAPSIAFIEYADRRRGASRAENLIAIADPNYSKSRPLAGASAAEIRAATRGSRHLAYFEPLPETRSEVQAIAKMFSSEKSELLFGEKALESLVKTADLSSYGFLHFATHGILGGEVPGVEEPSLVLGDEPGEDGFLTSSEVSKLKIGAELTVLSACNTGSGEFVTGEGVMGMSRAFLAAGSRSVVVSLWPVASKQTERLMVDFYRHLRSGRPAAEALRAAKLEMIEQAGKSGSPETHPFFWAPFILFGG